jgi:hypothetical protein
MGIVHLQEENIVSELFACDDDGGCFDCDSNNDHGSL